MGYKASSLFRARLEKENQYIVGQSKVIIKKKIAQIYTGFVFKVVENNNLTDGKSLK